MFQHHELNRNKNKKVNDKKVNNIVSLLTQFGDKHTYSGDTKPGSKFTSVVLILQLSANSSFTLNTQDLPVLISTQELLDLRSHLTILQSITAPVIYQTKNNKHNGEVTFKQKLQPYLKALSQNTRVYNSTHSPKHVSQTIQERLTCRLKTLKAKLFRMTA